MKKSEALKPIERDALNLERVDGSDEFGRPLNGYGSGYGFEEPQKRFSIREYWDAVRKRLWLIASLCVVITVATMVYVAQKPDYYSATARVQVNVEDNPAMASPKGFVLNSGYDPTYFSSQLQIIEGSGLLRRVVVGLDLRNNQAFLNPQVLQNRSVWQNTLRMIGMMKPGQNATAPAPTAQQTLSPASEEAPGGASEEVEIEELAPYVGLLRSGLTVTPVKETRVVYKETRLIDIKFTYYEPHAASKMANAIAEAYVAQNLEKKVSVNATAGDFLQKRIAELQSQIRANEERLINYAKNNQIISLDSSQNTVVLRLADLNARLSQAEGERIIAEAAFRASQLPGAASAQTETDSRALSVETRLSELRNQRSRLLVEFTDEAPEIVELDKQIALAQQEIKETRSRATSTLTTNFETKYRETLAREQDLRKIFNEQRAQVLAQNEAAINYRIIQQEIETNKSLLNGLLQRSKENDVLLSGTPNNVLIVDRALTPRRPVGPQRGQYIFLAFLCSLGLGIGLALLLHYLDNTLRSIDDVETKLQLPVLSAIPAVGQSKALIPLTSSLSRKKNGSFSSTVLDLNGNPALAEAYMHLRTSVLLATAGGPPETLLITSGQPAEGKTTTAINMATVLAQTGAKVLLIDADLRRPSVSTILGLANGNGNGHAPGLSSLLTGKALDDESVLQSIQFHEQTGLHILQSGPVPPNPANLLCSPQMKELIAILKSKFTHIVIDSPPVTFFTDGVLLSTLVDGVLLVVRSGKSSEDVVQRAKKILWETGANFFGVVLNDVSRPREHYYPYHYERPRELKEGDPSVLGLKSDQL